MNVTISPKVFHSFHPQFKVILFSLKNIDNKSKVKESWHLLQEMEHIIRLTFHKNTTKNSMLLLPWMVAQQKFGPNAKHYQTSLERLLSNVLRGKTTRAPDTITNLIRYFSLKYFVPMGVDDAEKIHGNIAFSVASGKEKVNVLRVLKKSALYYHDKQKILGTKLDYWKSSKTALKKTTTKVLVHIDILPPITDATVKEMLREMPSLFYGFCGGKMKVVVLSSKKKIGVV